MNMRYILAGVVLLLGILIYQESNAMPGASPTPLIKVQIDPPPGPDYVDHDVIFVGGWDTDDGKVEFHIKACGSMITLTVPKQMVTNQDERVVEAAKRAVDRACN